MAESDVKLLLQKFCTICVIKSLLVMSQEDISVLAYHDCIYLERGVEFVSLIRLVGNEKQK
jgi:hypothetical protein